MLKTFWYAELRIFFGSSFRTIEKSLGHDDAFFTSSFEWQSIAMPLYISHFGLYEFM